jgi:hypothetical protein
MLIICFDKEALAGDPIYSKSELSLEAAIGSRPIEVQGYTEVGKSPGTYRATVQTVTIVPEFSTFARQVRAISEGDDDLALVSKASLVRSSLEELTKDNRLDVTASLLQTSSRALSDQRQALENALIAESEARAKLVILMAEAPNSQRKLEELQRFVSQFERSLQEARERQSDLDRRLSDLTSAMDPDAAAIDEARGRRTASEDRVRDLERELEVNRDQLQKQADAIGRAKAEMADFEKAREESRRTVRSIINDLRASLPDPSRLLLAVQNLTSKVTNGYVNLKTQSAQAGDVLQINLRSYEAGSGVGGETYRTIPLATIFVKDYGFKSTVADSFMLVKRRNDETGTSNFKGAAGVSLLFSYQSRPSQRYWSIVNGISAGVNVSYLDFDPEKEIEIGAGPVFGLFKDRMHVGVGWNLNVPSDRFYYYVGFSFAKIQESLSGSNNDNSDSGQ